MSDITREHTRIFREALSGDDIALDQGIRVLERSSRVERPTMEDAEKGIAVVTRTVRAGFNVSSAGRNPSLSRPLPSYFGAIEAHLYFDGMLFNDELWSERPRKDLVDWYPGEDPSLGDVRFPFRVEEGVTLVMIVFRLSRCEIGENYRAHCLQIMRELVQSSRQTTSPVLTVETDTRIRTWDTLGDILFSRSWGDD